MLIIFMLVLIPSIFHVTTSLAINKTNTTTSSTIININNNSKQHDSTQSPLLVASGTTTHTILQDDDVKSKLSVNHNEILPPSSNRYRRNVDGLIEKSTYDPSYNTLVGGERNFSPQIVERLNTNGISSIDWKNAMLYRNRRDIIGGSPLAEEFSGMQIWNSVNLSGRRERPFFVDEPPYILVRRDADYPEIIESGVQNELFIPPRGRKADQVEKKSSLNNLFRDQNSDLFMPNRGKKFDEDDQYKRAKYNDLILGDDLFFPNRGKKSFPRTKLSAPANSVTQLLGTDDFFYPNRGKKSGLGNILKPNDLFYPNRGKKNRPAYIGDLADLDLFVPNRGKKHLLINKREILLNDKKQGNKSTTTTPTNNSNNNNNNNNDNKGDRYKRDLLDNLSKEKDTFYSARGRRNNNNSINNNGERNNDNNNNNNNNINEKFVDENNKNFLDGKFYTRNQVKKSTAKNSKNDYGITDDSRVKSFYFLKQIPSMYGMAGVDEMPKIRYDQQIIKNQQQEPFPSLINTDTITDGSQDNSMDSSNDINRFILPRYFDYTDNSNVQQPNYKK